MDKRFIVALLIIVGLFVGYLVFIKQDSPTETQVTAIKPTNHTVGAGNKKVTLTEYADFQCPVCGQYFPIIQEIKNKYGDDITFQMRHFPIDTIHPNARAAHRAAEAAGNQGKFFEMHDLLFQNQSAWSSSSNSRSIFESYAAQIGLSIDTFRQDFEKPELNDIINADISAGKEKGVTGTPTFFLNGRLLDESERRSYDDMVKAIDAEIARVAQQP